MKLWVVSRQYDTGPTYDAAFEFVVRAENQHEARKLAASQCGDEGSAIWHSHLVACYELTTEGPAEIIVGDFNAG